MTAYAVASVSGAERFAVRFVTGMASLAILERFAGLLPELVVTTGAVPALPFNVSGMEERHRALPGGKCDLFGRLFILGRSRRESHNREDGDEDNCVPHKCKYI